MYLKRNLAHFVPKKDRAKCTPSSLTPILLDPVFPTSLLHHPFTWQTCSVCCSAARCGVGPSPCPQEPAASWGGGYRTEMRALMRHVLGVVKQPCWQGGWGEVTEMHSSELEVDQGNGQEKEIPGHRWCVRAIKSR